MPHRPAFFNKERYVTLCQQLLVTATVTAVTLTAAGVVTLDIVAPPTDAGRGFSGLAPAVDVHPSYVDRKPVTPKVREVTVGRQAGAQTKPDARTVAPSDAQGRPSAPPNPTTTQTVHGLPVVLTSPPEKVSGYATVGVTWQPGSEPAEDQIAFQIRTRAHGGWSAWQKLQYHDDHGPDASDTADTEHARPGTDALVVGRVDQVQMRVAAASGKTPVGLQLALIDPGKDDLAREDPAIDTSRLPASDTAASSAPIEDTRSLPAAPADQTDATDASGSSRSGDTVALSAMKVAPKPKIFSRAQWGANEKIREKGLPNYGTIKTGFVHHTVNANNYHKKDVPALLRGIYAYHVISRGWRDIGYNFLVDRFGRIWEGRYGGVDRAVVGAHTLGFNEVSFAMSAIGNFDITRPPKVMLDAYARLFAWKLSKYNIGANASGIRVKGRTLHAINGHRDVGQTACPGRYLYAKLPYIRKEARKIQKNDSAAKPTPEPTPSPQPDPTDYDPLAEAAAAPPQPAIKFPRASSITGDSNRPDLVVQKPNGKVFVLRTGGMIDYKPPVTSSGNWAKMSKIVAVGDFSGDHRGDVMAKVRRTRNWLLFRGDGAGHISSKPVDAKPRLRNITQVITAGDWTGDGRADLLGVDRRNHALYLYPGAKGVGVFQHRQLLARNWGRFTKTVVVGDLNRDKRKDVAAFDSKHALYVALGSSSGRLGTPVKQGSFGAYNGLTGGGDLTGDGVGDVLVRQRSTGSALILKGNGKGGFTAHPFGPFPGMGQMSQLTAAQLAGGSRPDVLGRVGSRLQVRANNNLVNLRKPLYTKLTTQPSSAIYAVGDWNGDGRPDLITRQNGGDALWLRVGRGNGQFRTGILMSHKWKTLGRLTAVGDVTGDGHPDLMGKKSTGVMRIFPGNGKTGFLPPLRATRQMRTYNQVGTGSWNPAAMPDSVIGSSDRSFVPLAGVTRQLRASADGFARQYDWLIGLGDVNEDGLSDLLGRQGSDGTLWLIPGTATGFGPRQFVGSGLGKYRLVG